MNLHPSRWSTAAPVQIPATGPPNRPNSGSGDTVQAAVTTTGNLTKSQKIQKSLKSNPKLFFNPLEHKFKPQNMRSNKNQENFNKPKRFIFILLKSLF
jgi:hypothetical protein